MSLVRYLGKHRETFEDHEEVDIDKVLNVKTLQDYDKEITLKLWVIFSLLTTGI